MQKFYLLQEKAANAGGVAASGLEMTQNSIRLNWTSEEVDARLKDIMTGIHGQCKNTVQKLMVM